MIGPVVGSAAVGVVAAGAVAAVAVDADAVSTAAAGAAVTGAGAAVDGAGVLGVDAAARCANSNSKSTEAMMMLRIEGNSFHESKPSDMIPTCSIAVRTSPIKHMQAPCPNG